MYSIHPCFHPINNISSFPAFALLDRLVIFVVVVLGFLLGFFGGLGFFFFFFFFWGGGVFVFLCVFCLSEFR